MSKAPATAAAGRKSNRFDPEDFAGVLAPKGAAAGAVTGAEPRSLPDSRRQSGGNSSYTERQDRLYREPAAGARLEIPFSY